MQSFLHEGLGALSGGVFVARGMVWAGTGDTDASWAAFVVPPGRQFVAFDTMVIY